MENTSKFLYLSFATVLFCLGISILILNIKDYKKLLSNVIDNYNNNNLVSEVPYTEGSYSIYKKSQIIGLLSEPLNYDVQIDKTNIKKYRNNSYNDICDANILSHEVYRKQYLYDYEGNIRKIVFTAIEIE